MYDPCLIPQTIYMFCALALVCDDYFVPSLEKICEVGMLVIINMQYFANENSICKENYITFAGNIISTR